MNYKKSNNHILLSLQNQDYINKSIEQVFVNERLKSGWVSGLGAIYDVELGFVLIIHYEKITLNFFNRNAWSIGCS